LPRSRDGSVGTITACRRSRCEAWVADIKGDVCATRQTAALHAVILSIDSRAGCPCGLKHGASPKNRFPEYKGLTRYASAESAFWAKNLHWILLGVRPALVPRTEMQILRPDTRRRGSG
jgi:hypothetical protein